jgi:hypothetical protein
MLASSTIGSWVLRCRPLHVRWLTIQASFLEAHNAYVKQHRTAIIPVGFVVPSDSSDWPPALHGMELGKEATRYRQQFLDQSMPVDHILHDIEFVWERSAYQWAHVGVPTLMAYKTHMAI